MNSTFLLILEQNGRAKVHRFCKERVTIGRSKDSDLPIPDLLVSRHHCRVERSDSCFFLVDEGGQNPVTLRGVPVDRAELRVGDTFVVGSSEVTLELPVEEPLSADETLTGEGSRSAQDMAAFVSVARALNEEQDLFRLLTLIVDSAIRLSNAERGFLLLSGGEEPVVEVARNFAQEEVHSPAYKISRTIAQGVLESGLPELTTNAQEDERFRDFHSVEDLRLRSILCVPIRISGVVGGVLYVDNRLQQQVFSEREKVLLALFSDHAGVAIRNAHTMDDLRNKKVELQSALDRVGRLNAALKGQVDEQQAELSEIREELGSARRGGRYKYDYSAIVGESLAMTRVFDLLDRYIGADEAVIILGESGTGKELVARAVHQQSSRCEGPFISENVAALPESLLESELFGHVKGSFTGADRDKPGLFQLADGGVIFLDEIGDMPLDLQTKLLRVLEEGVVRPIGSGEEVKIDVRLITATNRDIDGMVRGGDFREDLYYRLNVLPVHLPPLRDRREDIAPIALRFLTGLAHESGVARIRMSSEAMEVLSAYHWPGNVRELQNEIRRAAVVSDGVILREHLSDQVKHPKTSSPAAVSGVIGDGGVTLPDLVRDLEIRLITECYERAHGNKSRASQLLGLSRFALQRKLDKYGIGHAQRADSDVGIDPDEGGEG
jgi:transcriptional regulator with GAF, ATPase, and Fis domain